MINAVKIQMIRTVFFFFQLSVEAYCIPVNFLKISWGRQHKNVQFYWEFMQSCSLLLVVTISMGWFLEIFLLFKGRNQHK